MSQSSQPVPKGPIKPLDLGNVVSAAFRLYKSHVKQYLGLAAKATLWVFVPILALVPLAFGAAVGGARNPLVGLLLPAWLGLFLYGIAKALTHTTAIYRLAYQELIDQPETSQQALKFTASRMWSFLLTSIYQGLLALGFVISLYLSVAIVLGIPYVAIINALGGFRRMSFSGGIVTFFFVLIGLCVLLVAFLWFVSRMVIADLSLAIEPHVTATSTIGRGWNLTHKNSLRIMAITFVAGIISTLMQIPFEIPRIIANQVLTSAIATDNSQGAAIIFLVVALVFSLLGNIFIIPFWQALKTVIYYDLRSRREGLGLQLRDR
jgi:hypothetical protein